MPAELTSKAALMTTTDTAPERFRLFPELDRAGEGPFSVQHQQPDFKPPHRLFEPSPAQFDAEADAITACKRAADQLLLASLQPGMSGRDLWEVYQRFGNGFGVLDRVGLLHFSADTYAHRRCAELAPAPYAPAPREAPTPVHLAEQAQQEQQREQERAIREDNDRRAAGARHSLALVLWFLGAILLGWAIVKASGMRSAAGGLLHEVLLGVAFFYFVALFWLRGLVDRLFAPRR